MSKKPPFRADHVGSLMRPSAILQARQQVALQRMSSAALRELEDEHIARAVQKQESLGLKSITDGEYRRAYFHLDFLKQLDGVSVTGAIDASSDAKKKVGFTPPKLSVTGKLQHVRTIQVDDFNYLKSKVISGQIPKVTIPSPTMIHFRGGRAAIDIESYPDMDEFFKDLAECYRKEIGALYEAGCRYIQMDDTNLAYLCDPKMRQGAMERGDDPDELPRTYAALINSVIENRPEDLRICVHLCRGNFKSTWFAEGGYEPVAEVLFNELNVDGFFLEYDDERSGDFQPLRFVPKGKNVVLGLVSTKISQLEDPDYLMKRIEDAAQFVGLEQLCLSPQCGFSSTHHGNDITEDDQWRKLDLVVDTAKKVWGN